MLMIDGLLSKTVKRGFEFTLMVVGESGLGKSTMINSLFLTELYRNRTLPPVQVRTAGGSICKHKCPVLQKILFSTLRLQLINFTEIDNIGASGESG